MTVWQQCPQDAHDAAYDEECLKWVSVSSWRWRHEHLRLPRLRRVFVWLLLADLVIVGSLLCIFDPLITLLRRNDELFGDRIQLSAPDAAADAARHHRIPRILHQTTANETIPDKWVDSQRSCKETYSDFEYKLWTDASAREFLATEYPWFIDIWDNYPFVIQRADAIRYFVLHHYGGIYLDMDTVCKDPFPLDQIEEDGAKHHAVFKSTLPTGVTNDFMIASARHPAYTAAVSRIPSFNAVTQPWARLLPYCAIMISSGPFFLTMVVKDYLLALPSLPSRTVRVYDQAQLEPFITDLESSTWHKSDAQLLMWIGDRPWTWFAMGAVGLAAGLWVLNHLLVMLYRGLLRKIPAVTSNLKLAKLM